MKKYISLILIIVLVIPWGLLIFNSKQVFGLTIPQLDFFYLDDSDLKPQGSWNIDLGSGDLTADTINYTTLNPPVGGGADEKVKYDAGDPTAGNLSAKVVAGEGITILEGAEDDENKVKISTTWLLDPVEEHWDITEGLPPDPELGDRYISDGTDEELGWYDGYIYEWDGEEWYETIPIEGMMVWLIWEMVWWVFFSGGWMEMGSGTYVPYTGANQDVNLGAYNLTLVSGDITLTNGSLKMTSEGIIYFDEGGEDEAALVHIDNGQIGIKNHAGVSGILDMSDITTSNKTFSFPDSSGTVALEEGLVDTYVNVTGDTMTGLLTVATMSDSVLTVFNGTISGATSISSTSFTGALTGNASTASSAFDVSCSECLILGTEVKAGTLTDTKLCTWDDANSQIVCNSTDTDTKLSQEEVEDYAGAMVSSNTETLITVTYQDADGTIDFVVDNDLSHYSNATSAFITENQTITLSGDISGSGATSITTTIGNDKILEAMLKAVDSASDEDILTYETTGGDFEWHSKADLGIGTATAITDDLIVMADLNQDNEPSDGDILTYDSTGGNFAWITQNAGTDITADLEEETHASEHLVGAADTIFPADPGADKYLMWDDDAGVLVWASPAGSGDVESVGDCTTGACLDGSSDGGGYIRLYDGDSNYVQLDVGDLSGDITVNLPTSAGTLALYEQFDTIGEVETIWGSVNILLETEIDASSELAALMDDETGTGYLVFSNSPTFDDDITIHATGVKITGDGDGAITLLGLGDGFDENLVINFDDTENQIDITSGTGVTDIDFNTINLMTDLLDLGTNTLDDTHLGYIKGWEHGSNNSKLDGGDLYAGSVAAGAYAAASIDGDDINSNIAGRSLTLTGASPDTLNADAELYTDTKCIYWEDPTADDDFKSIWFAKQAVTITSLWCESDQTVTAMLQVDDGSPADVDSVDLTCDSTPPEDTSLNGDTTMASGNRLDVDVASVANTPTWVSICWTFTYDD